MKINLGERQDIKELQTQHQMRRDKFIENYKFHLPFIQDFIYYPTKRNHKFSFLTDQLRDIDNIENSFKLFKTIVDIRNNNEPTSPESNCLMKSDNKFSNEMKNHISVLVRKGWRYNEVVYEIERIYGSGILSSTEYFEKPYFHEYMVNGGIILVGSLISLKLLLISFRVMKKLF